MSKIYIGTAGWSYKDWVPNFYPKNQSVSFDWLEFYSHYFNTIEVNSTYYTYIRPSIVDGWIRKVSNINDFLFTVKLHQDFTHKKNYSKEQSDFVKSTLNKLGRENRLGGQLMQFPYSFSFNSATAEYLSKLVSEFEEFDNFVEVRHKSWQSEEAMEFIKELRVSFCTIDQPQIGESIPFEPVVMNDIAYLRFHGRNVDAWKNSIKNFGKEQSYSQQNERYNYLYTLGELSELERKIKEIFNAAKKIFIVMNNHPQGKAVANALEFMSLLAKTKKVDVPDTTLKAFPRLRNISLN